MTRNETMQKLPSGPALSTALCIETHRKADSHFMNDLNGKITLKNKKKKKKKESTTPVKPDPALNGFEKMKKQKPPKNESHLYPLLNMYASFPPKKKREKRKKKEKRRKGEVKVLFPCQQSENRWECRQVARRWRVQGQVRRRTSSGESLR